ncbi:hypothetical protein [Corallincola luteus]|nr:hypothetical protein [Corallincola luteus]
MSDEQHDRKLKRQLRQQRKKLKSHDQQTDDWDDQSPQAHGKYEKRYKN